ncbi:MAG: protein translocase subunit SecF [Dehalococcoidia bacterium]
MIDFSGKRWYYLSVSLVLFVVAAIFLGLWGLKPGIEFTSGSTFTFEFPGGGVTQPALKTALSELGHGEARIQSAGENAFLIRTSELEGPEPTSGGTVGPAVPVRGEIDDIQDALCTTFGTTAADGACSGVVRRDFSTISETVSSEIARNATFAVIAASIAILIYISVAFRRMRRPYRYGVAAVIALVHDAFIVLGLFAFLGEFRGTEVDTAFITAILTVIGFSVHDTIVVFDRVREMVQNDQYVPFEEAVNASLTETLARSINTSLVVVITVLAMLLIGGESIRNFLIVLLVGIIAGTYSSIGVASQVLVAWDNGDIGKFFRRLRGQGTTVSEPA